MENIANDERNHIPRTEENQDSEIQQTAIRSDTDVEKQRVGPRTPSIFKMRRRTGSSMSFRRQFTSRGQVHSDNKDNSASLETYRNILLLSSGRENIENDLCSRNSTSRRMALAGNTCAKFLRDKLEQLSTQPLVDFVIAGTADDDDKLSRVVAIATRITTLRRIHQNIPIDGKKSLIRQLVEGDEKLFTQSCLNIHNNKARHIVFAILGWTTMLYDPQLPPTLESDHFEIAADGPTCFTKTVASCEKAMRPFSEILYAFGKIIPDQEWESLDDVLSVASLNVVTLQSGNITVKWVYSLSAHLDFNSTTGELSVFCLPSFCEIHDGPNTSLEKLFRYDSFNSPGDFSFQSLTREVLLSYHLLFRDDLRSRRHFQKVERSRIKRMENNLRGEVDPLLNILCGAEDFKQSSTLLPCRLQYGKSSEFPTFAQRLSVLQEYMKRRKPGKLAALWKDRRDYNSFYTFWAVLVFGSLGVLLGVMQVVLSTFQVVYAVKSYNAQLKSQSSV